MTVEERFWAKVKMPAGDGCWEWTACRNGGYGQFCVGGKRRVYAHRFAYECLVGPIPDGLQIDHLCRNPACVNPAHLEVVTSAENTARGYNPWATNARKTHCKRGHAFTPENTYRTPKGRECLECKKMLGRQRWLRMSRAEASA